jgi:hypothetical protein
VKDLLQIVKFSDVLCQVADKPRRAGLVERRGGNAVRERYAGRSNGPNRGLARLHLRFALRGLRAVGSRKSGLTRTAQIVQNPGNSAHPPLTWRGVRRQSLGSEIYPRAGGTGGGAGGGAACIGAGAGGGGAG